MNPERLALVVDTLRNTLKPSQVLVMRSQLGPDQIHAIEQLLTYPFEENLAKARALLSDSNRARIRILLDANQMAPFDELFPISDQPKRKPLPKVTPAPAARPRKPATAEANGWVGAVVLGMIVLAGLFRK